MLVAGFDTETSGLQVEKDFILQVGVVLWDTAAPKKKAKLKFDALINSPLLPADLDPTALEINGLTREDLERFGQSPEAVLKSVNMIFEMSDAIVAHNGNLFDRPMYESNCRRHGIEPVRDKLWIDTSCDIDYPAAINTRKLVYLAVEHDFINPFPHDAISDVLTMLKVADRYDWEKTVAWAKSPTLAIRADSTFQQKELVKKQNYRWNNEKKIWTKSIKEFQLEDARKAAKEAGFSVTVLPKGGA